MARTASANQVRVFINCPFDKPYERLFLALISGIVCVGLEPHCVLELPAHQKRLDRLHKGEVNGILRCVLNSLGPASGTSRPTMLQLTSVAEGVIQVMRSKRRQQEIDTFFDRNGFQSAVFAATELAQQAGLVP